MAIAIKGLNGLFKDVYADRMVGIFTTPKFKRIRNTKLARKIYAGKVGGYDSEWLLIPIVVTVSLAARVEMATNLLQMGLIDNVDDYLKLLETGK